VVSDDELSRLDSSAPSGEPESGHEVLRVVAADTDRVLARARSVLRTVIEGLSTGLAPDDPGWATMLPPWFVESFGPAVGVARERAWLQQWRQSARQQRAELERERVWTLVGWLVAMQKGNRTWRWWSAERDLVTVLVDGRPSPSGSLHWLLLQAGAQEVHEHPDAWEPIPPEELPWTSRPRRSFWDAMEGVPPRLVLALVTFPYICLGMLAYGAARGWPADEVGLDASPVVVVLALVAVPETVLAVLWLRRPTRAPRRLRHHAG
jgi:hypothetical protein